MRAAIVGTGFIARVHALALQSLGVEVAAVAGSRPGRAEELGSGCAYSDLGELLSRESVDVLHICTPNDVHAAQALAAIEQGVHVVCEKPLAVSTSESRAMVEAAEAAGVVNATCYHVRGYPLVEQMRSEVASGAMGEVVVRARALSLRRRAVPRVGVAHRPAPVRARPTSSATSGRTGSTSPSG